MVYLTIALLALALLFAAMYLLQRSQAKRLTKQLETLNKEQRTQIVTMSFPSRVNQDLVREINCFLLDKQETERKWRTESFVCKR